MSHTIHIVTPCWQRRWRLGHPVPFMRHTSQRLREAIAGSPKTPSWSAEDIARITEIYYDTKIALVKGWAFYAWVVMGMRTEWLAPDAPFAAATGFRHGSLTMFIHPREFLKMTSAEQMAVLRHEVEHVVRGHLVRGEGLLAHQWNLAADAAINPSIQGLPSWVVMPDKLALPPNLSAEEYYAELMRRHNPATCAECQAGQGHGDPHNANHGFWQEIPASQRRLVEAQIRRLVRHAQRQAGSVPRELQAAVDRLMQYEALPWYEILRRFVARASQIQHQINWRKFHRRFGEEFPGVRRRPLLNLAIAVDTSGSISPAEIAQFFREILAIQATTQANIWVFESDARIHAIYPFRGIPETIGSRGGTDFEPFFAALRHPQTVADLIPNPRQYPRQWDAAIYLTDGYPMTAPNPAGIPTLWALTAEGRKPVPWGEEVRLPPVGSVA